MDLSLSYVVGHVFADGERLTAAMLNQALRFVFTLTGSISSLSIADGAVTLPKLDTGLITGAPAGTVTGPDLILFWSIGSGAYQQCTAAAIAALAFTGLVPLTAPALGNTTVVNDGANKTSTLQAVFNAFGGLTALTYATLDAAADSLVTYDASGTVATRALASNVVRKVVETVVTTAGTATAYTAASGFTFLALADGLAINVKLHAASGLTPTLNVDALGAKAIRTQDDMTPATAQFPINTLIHFVYNSSANSGAGGWLATGFSSNVGPIFAVLDGSVGLTFFSVSNIDAASDEVTCVAHGLADGTLVWSEDSLPAGGTLNTPYYVRSTGTTVPADRFWLYATKAGALAGGATDRVNFTASGAAIRHFARWTSNPLKASRGIDGIIFLDGTGGTLVVDFTVARASVNYCPQLSIGFDLGSLTEPFLYFVDTVTSPTTELFYLQVFTGLGLPKRVFLSVFE